MHDAPPEPAARVTPIQKSLAYGVHLLTASGVVFAFLAIAEILAPACDPRRVFLWFACATIVDAIDGPLARRLHVKQRVPHIDGRTIDDLVDYLMFTFLPLVLVWRMGWLPGSPAGVGAAAVILAMLTSLLGFANTRAKQESQGFFLGFPSYWNIAAFYLGLFHAFAGPWVNLGIVLVLAILTVTPIRVIYPNLAPRPWRAPLLAGALLWLVVLLAILPWYPRVPAWAVGVSLIYPAFYTAASIVLDARSRRKLETLSPQSE